MYSFRITFLYVCFIIFLFLVLCQIIAETESCITEIKINNCQHNIYNSTYDLKKDLTLPQNDITLSLGCLSA